MSNLVARFVSIYLELQTRLRVMRLAREVAAQAPASPTKATIVFFNTSTRLRNLSLNAAFSLLTSWGLRLAGLRVVHFVCRAGMSRCVLGTNRDDHTASPPCEACIAQSRRLYTGAEAHWFSYTEDRDLAAALEGLDLEALSHFRYQGRNLGELVLPSLRWILRRHHLEDDPPTRFLLRQYILSAHNVGEQFAAFLDETQPDAVLLFNGIMYPEAIARQVALERGLPVITHEVGLRPFTGFFTPGQATAYPIDIPDDFELDAAQKKRLDAYLEKRFQGQFSMAGIQFWPEMRGLDETLLSKIEQFKQVVPVFTNVIFDTSQVHANTVFPHMFAWLDLILEIVRAHPDTLFVIRAHPDEMRPGTAKGSRETVAAWVARYGVADLPNVIFINSGEYVSSYALINRAKFVMVYNSSIGLEASLMGAPVLCGGKARFTQIPTVFFPSSPRAYRQQTEEFLLAEEITPPEEFERNARRFFYYQLFRTSLPFGDYLKARPRLGYVGLRRFPIERLSPANSPAVQTILDGLLHDGDFLLSEAEE